LLEVRALPKGLASFCWIQHQAGRHLEEMPSGFLLGFLRNHAQQGAVMLHKNFSVIAGRLFMSIGGAHSHDWIIVGHQLDHGMHQGAGAFDQ
jgi:hypothetical protein